LPHFLSFYNSIVTNLTSIVHYDIITTAVVTNIIKEKGKWKKLYLRSYRNLD